MNKKIVAVIGGGDSSEFEISIGSARNVKNWIDSNIFDSFLIRISNNNWKVLLENGCEVDIDRNDFSFYLYQTKVVFDCVLIVIHGTPGENGILQSYFELVGIPYNTCNVFVSALTFNKNASKVLLEKHGIKTAKSLLVTRKQTLNFSEIEKEIGFPCFVKPNESGSSCGVSKVENLHELGGAIEQAFAESPDVLIEAALVGTEISHGLAVIGGKEYVFPITEIIPKTVFFDYNAKYDGDKSEEITPARLSDDMTKRCRAISLKIYHSLNCRGIVRIDYIIQNNDPYFLEINTVPGMSKNSIVPQQIAAMGMTVTEFLTLLINEMLS